MQKESSELRPGMAEELATESTVCVASQGDRPTAQRDAEAFEGCAKPRNSALSGLAVAVAISIAVWTAIAALVWLVLR